MDSLSFSFYLSLPRSDSTIRTANGSRQFPGNVPNQWMTPTQRTYVTTRADAAEKHVHSRFDDGQAVVAPVDSRYRRFFFIPTYIDAHSHVSTSNTCIRIVVTSKYYSNIFRDGGWKGLIGFVCWWLVFVYRLVTPTSTLFNGFITSFKNVWLLRRLYWVISG